MSPLITFRQILALTTVLALCAQVSAQSLDPIMKKIADGDNYLACSAGTTFEDPVAAARSLYEQAIRDLANSTSPNAEMKAALRAKARKGLIDLIGDEDRPAGPQAAWNRAYEEAKQQHQKHRLAQALAIVNEAKPVPCWKKFVDLRAAIDTDLQAVEDHISEGNRQLAECRASDAAKGRKHGNWKLSAPFCRSAMEAFQNAKSLDNANAVAKAGYDRSKAQLHSILPFPKWGKWLIALVIMGGVAYGGWWYEENRSTNGSSTTQRTR